MKKLALALISGTVATVGATNANLSTGAYSAVGLGYGGASGKYTASGLSGSADIGGNAVNGSIYVGYGWFAGCLYLGGEVAYTFENTKINNTLGGSGGSQAQLKRNGFFSAALRGGYLFTPNTMMYIRASTTWGKWILNDSLVFGTATPGTGTKNRLGFAPGVGLETAVHKNVYVRVEYNYEFGPSVRATNPNLSGTTSNVGSIRDQYARVILSYKF